MFPMCCAPLSDTFFPQCDRDFWVVIRYRSRFLASEMTFLRDLFLDSLFLGFFMIFFFRDFFGRIVSKQGGGIYSRRSIFSALVLCRKTSIEISVDFLAANNSKLCNKRTQLKRRRKLNSDNSVMPPPRATYARSCRSWLCFPCFHFHLAVL